MNEDPRLGGGACRLLFAVDVCAINLGACVWNCELMFLRVIVELKYECRCPGQNAPKLAGWESEQQ